MTQSKLFHFTLLLIAKWIFLSRLEIPSSKKFWPVSRSLKPAKIKIGEHQYWEETACCRTCLTKNAGVEGYTETFQIFLPSAFSCTAILISFSKDFPKLVLSSCVRFLEPFM